MLFDLRSRHRRRAVKVTYTLLALLMGGGLVLFGVGTGQSGGGLLNAFGGSGSNGAQNQVVSQQETAALKQIKQDPNSAQAWGNLLEARWTTAVNGNDYSSTTGFTAAGKRELNQTIQAWGRYIQLTHSPDPDLATLAARAYAALGNYSGAANAWGIESAANPGAYSGYECLAVTSYAAGDTRKGELAATKALSLLPKSQQATAKLTLNDAKSSTSAAKSAAAQC